MISGIYQIRNLANGKIYVGKSNNLLSRKSDHLVGLRNQKHKNNHLQNAWNKYGEENFIFEILEECEKDKLFEREQCWLDKTQCYNRKIGYNKATKAVGPIGIKRNKETREKLRQAFAKLSWEKVREIRELHQTGEYSYVDLAKMFEVSRTTVGTLLMNRSWYDKSYIPLRVRFRTEKKGNFHSAKLTWEIVEEIRERHQKEETTLTNLAKDYKVCVRTVSDIVKNKTWRKK